MIEAGLDARITCVDPRVLPASYAGRTYDTALVESLPAGVDPCGERGEFHTCVIAGPMFSNRIAVEAGEVVERDGFVFADLRLAHAELGPSGAAPHDSLRATPRIRP
jgi:diphthamide synthase (EF-2-diphthine--ammonia ligase)